MTSEDEIINNINLSNFEENEKNDFFGFEASKKKVLIIHEQKRIFDKEAKIKYSANRVFINHGDSYLGKHIIHKINQVSQKDIENTNLDHKLIENSIFKDTSKRQELINENKSLEEIQNKTISADVDNNLRSVSVSHDKGVLNESNTKRITESDSLLVKSQLSINSETVSTKLTNKPIIEPKKYDIITTVKNKLHINDEKYSYLKHTKKIIIPNNKKSLIKEVQKCAIIVYDISLDKNQITEVNIVLKEIIEEIDYMKSHPKSTVTKQSGIKVFILISSIQTWALTTNKSESPITQADYKRRICHPNYKAYYKIENDILLLNDKYKGYFQGIILVPGLVYGHGEYMLKYIYETAFSDNEQLLIPKYYNNLPIIHIENLAKIIKNLIVYYDKVTQPYIVGVETSRFSLRKITEAIKDEVHKTNYVYCNNSSLFLNSRVTQTVYDMIMMSIHIVPVIDDYITDFISLDSTIPKIFTKTKEIISEYLKKNSKTRNIIINGPNEITKIAKKIANTYNLQYIDSTTTSEEFLNILETHISNININQSGHFGSDKFNNHINQIPVEIMSNDIASFQTFNVQHVETNNENQQNNQPMFNKYELLEEQKKYFEKKGQISNNYLLLCIKNKILNKGNKYGYLLNNFPQTIEQAQHLFNLKQKDLKEENNKQFFKNEKYPTIIIDLIMAGKNIIEKVRLNSDMEQVQSDFSSKLYNDKLDKSNEWFSLDSQYTENEVMKHFLENDDIEIRKNRKLIDYLEVIFKPKVNKKYFLITENNFPTINEDELDNLFNSIVISMPVKVTVNEKKDELSRIKHKINKMFDSYQTEFKNKVLTHGDETYEKNVNQILNETTEEENNFSSNNHKIIHFLIRCVNPILVNGIIEIMKNKPDDPIDFLVEYIYNHNMYNPCVSSPLDIKRKEANSLNQHLL